MDVVMDIILIIAAVIAVARDSYRKRHEPIRIENWANRRAEKR